MSLEVAIANLTAAVERNSSLLERMMSSAGKVVPAAPKSNPDTQKGGKDHRETIPAGTRAATEEDKAFALAATKAHLADEKAPKQASQEESIKAVKAATTKTEERSTTLIKPKTPAKKPISEAAYRSQVGGYMGVADKAERAVRKENVAAIIGFYGVERATEIPQESWNDVINVLGGLLDGGNVDELLADLGGETLEDVVG